MAKPADRVDLVKQESSSRGGDDADSVEILIGNLDPSEDMPNLAGVAFQESDGGGGDTNDDLVTIWREAGKLILEDSENAPVDLATILAGGGLDPNKLLTARSDGMVFVFRSSGNVVQRK